ncbi:hypothetical protein H6P81_018032 [Aristolochia fimbriata]|uniref:Uncharacterized protein n=1 Tax=Aristolochia fimbriata TaxID=158543 RepID=A0AAV7E0C0_ARIFI|nr:hypothetical protein H6P81_018032 [Aristolochia fimbriata]
MRDAGGLSPSRSRVTGGARREAAPFGVVGDRFPGSRVCVGIVLHHTATDGTGFVNFEKSWASIFKSGSVAKTVPSFDRAVVGDHRQPKSDLYEELKRFATRNAPSGTAWVDIRGGERAGAELGGRARRLIGTDSPSDPRGGEGSDERRSERAIPVGRQVAETSGLRDGLRVGSAKEGRVTSILKGLHFSGQEQDEPGGFDTGFGEGLRVDWLSFDNIKGQRLQKISYTPKYIDLGHLFSNLNSNTLYIVAISSIRALTNLLSQFAGAKDHSSMATNMKKMKTNVSDQVSLLGLLFLLLLCAASTPVVECARPQMGTLRLQCGFGFQPRECTPEFCSDYCTGRYKNQLRKSECTPDGFCLCSYC